MNNWQRDPRWGNIKLGTSNTFIKDYGCLISIIGNIVGTTPDVVNERLKAVGGFAYGNLVIWAKIEQAFPGIKVRRVWAYDNEDVKKNTPNTVVEVPAKAIGGTGKHWVRFIGNFKCEDPWTGTVRPTQDFVQYGNPTGYAVLSGSWNQPQPTPPSDQDLINRIESVIHADGEARTKVSKIREILK